MQDKALQEQNNTLAKKVTILCVCLCFSIALVDRCIVWISNLTVLDYIYDLSENQIKEKEKAIIQQAQLEPQSNDMDLTSSVVEPQPLENLNIGFVYFLSFLPMSSTISPFLSLCAHVLLLTNLCILRLHEASV